jgi:hypothetical protein
MRDKDLVGVLCFKHRKKRYGTKKIALAKAKQTEKLNPIKLDIYKCPECKCWHLTKRRVRDERGTEHTGSK